MKLNVNDSTDTLPEAIDDAPLAAASSTHSPPFSTALTAENGRVDGLELQDIPDNLVPDAAHPIRVRKRIMPAGNIIARHQHAWAQLAYPHRGVLRITTHDTTWIVPPTRAIWIPSHIEHEVASIQDARMQSLYIDEEAAAIGIDTCRVLEVSPLLRELISAMARGPLPVLRDQLLVSLTLDELTHAEVLPLGVPMPSDKRLRALCEAILLDPSRSDSLSDWSQQAGASTRTIARLFRRELGMSFSSWRQHAVLARAIPMLGENRPLSQIAQELGYASQSAFSAMFRRAVGKSPRAFLSGNERSSVGTFNYDV
ncbi:MAG: AraC family transcriptional regulator [Janthinobacterium lividum]